MPPPRRMSFKPIKQKPQKDRLVGAKPFKPKPRQSKPKVGPKPGLGQGPAPVSPRPALTGQHMVPDASYLGALDRSERQQTARLGDLESQERQVKHEFGIDDPTNPFSRVNSMKKAFLTRQKSASVGLAGQGKLYSGTHERALARTRREEEQARSELRSAYEGAIGQIGAEKLNVKFNTEEERAQAFEEWLARAPEADVDLSEEEINQAEAGGGGGQGLNPSEQRFAQNFASQAEALRGRGLTKAEAKRINERSNKKAQALSKALAQRRERHQSPLAKHQQPATRGKPKAKPKKTAKPKKKGRR